ncbi:MAG: hypothetical protein CMJ81_04730 [Planctomycetaceae bacterium]|nr:hypothetical protein [Planctomycetaceae bacterium]
MCELTTHTRFTGAQQAWQESRSHSLEGEDLAARLHHGKRDAKQGNLRPGTDSKSNANGKCQNRLLKH